MSTSANKKISATNMPKKKVSQKPKPNITKKDDVKKFPIFNTETKKMVNVTNIYGSRAKELYKQAIVANPSIHPSMFLPDGLKWTGTTLRKVKLAKPKVELRSSFKNYIAEVTIRNTENILGYDGVTEMMKGFTTVIQDYQKSRGIVC